MTQIKVGFDKRPATVVRGLQPLLSYPDGQPLVDQSGNPLYTEEDAFLLDSIKSKNATSVYVNNDGSDPVKVVEQFPEISEVSSTLLGIPRAETQLSLFSDVSTYGLNPEEFEFFRYTSRLNFPTEWYERENPVYGAHYNTKLVEETNEQALVVTAYPVPYTFPYGPNNPTTGPVAYEPDLYGQFKKFVELGNRLYEDYKDDYPVFAENNFLNQIYIRTVAGQDSVIYDDSITEEEGYRLLERWTFAWINMRDRLLIDPETEFPLEFPPTFDASNTLPGYYSNTQYFGSLQSKKAFRYQPGRISGFTFGFRCSTDPSSADNVTEWGIGNPSDQYLFRIRGGNFSIVRRSVVPLPNTVLQSTGLSPDAQTFQRSGNAVDTTFYHTLEIPQDRFNGDSLDGNGRSGYILDPTKVTMYKIEFGWYGAIGAKFYAYTPVENGEARWILIHTLIIENLVGEPCLKDPYFKFIYNLDIRNTQSIRQPQFIYKYGASCYIDGGDDNTGSIYSYSSDELNIDNISETSLLGIYAKENLSNQLGDEIVNKKNIYPLDLKVTAEQLTRINIKEINGGPGFGHHYAPSLHSKEVGRIVSLTLNDERTEFSINDNTFTSTDNDKKIIVEGIQGTYLNIEDDNIASLSRIGRGENYEKLSSQTLPENVIASDTITPVSELDFSSVRITGYDAIAASSYPITGSRVDVNFLNPNIIESSGQFCEFFIGVTTKKPTIITDIETGNDELKFIESDGSTIVDIQLNDIFYEEYTESGILYSRDGYELREIDYPIGQKMDIDYRLSRPSGSDSGVCSSIRFEILPKEIFNVTYSNNVNGVSGNFLVFNSTPSTLLGNVNLKGGEYGIDDSGTLRPSGIFFESESVLSYQNSLLETIYYIEITSSTSGTFDIYLSPVRLSDRSRDILTSDKKFSKARIFQFKVKPLYVVIGMRDNARVNNITFNEFRNNITNSISPEWITNGIVDIVNSGNSQTNRPATNYVDNNRLSSASIDTQLSQPLRPGKTISTLYISPNTTESINLTGIFGSDKKVISPGLLNSTAYFITAKSLEDGSINEVSVNLNTREQ